MGKPPVTQDPLVHALSATDGYVFTSRRWTDELARKTADRIFALHDGKHGLTRGNAVVRFRTESATKTVGGRRRIGYNITADPETVAKAVAKSDCLGAAQPKASRRERARRQSQRAKRTAS
ncbi:MAG: hypothetical protein CMM84_03680 [Rhodothermaceae bacterium]|nr:hypothetical protein [Rhodothermaceae bacterium]MBC15317.1 hypothetical protein [Rhodothermaceae bacterium]